MQPLLSFTEYATRSQVIAEQRSMYINIFNQFEEVKPVINEAIALVDAGLFDDMLLEDLMSIDDASIEENLIQKAKEKFDKAVAVAKEKGKQALTDTQQMIIKIGGDIGKVIKLVVQNIAKACKTAYDKVYAMALKAGKAKAPEIKDAIEGVTDKSLLANEIVNATKMLKSFKAWVLSGFHKEMAQAMQKAAKDSDTNESFSPYGMELGLYKSINEAVLSGELDFSTLNEAGGVKIPFVSSIAAKLNKIPPFSLLYKVKNKVKDFVGNSLEKFSVWATEVAGAPGPYKFVALATIIGVITEMEVKDVGKKLLKASLHSIPFAGTVIVWTATIAKYLAYIAIIETLIDVTKEEQPKKA